MGSLRVVVVDDSPFVRTVLKDQLETERDIVVVGEAGNGEDAVNVVLALRPDVVTMDILMPLMNGFEAIQRIMAECPMPIVVVADAANEESQLALDAIAAGAVEVFAKPRLGSEPEAGGELRAAVRRAAESSPSQTLKGRTSSMPSEKSAGVIGIVASTGGPPALKAVVQALSPQAPPAVLLQHSDPRFTAALLRWLERETGRELTFSAPGMSLSPGQIILATAHRHTVVSATRKVELVASPSVSGHCPSATVLLESLAGAYGRRAVGIVLTGMGNDGAAGLRRIVEVGGTAVVQDPDSAVAPGMPTAALEVCPTASVGALDEIGVWLEDVRP